MNLLCTVKIFSEGDDVAAWMHSDMLSFYLELQTTPLLFLLDLGKTFPGMSS